MEVKLDKRYPLEVSVDQAWAVLADIRAVAGCMPGAAITDEIDATHYKGTVKAKVGPATMSFAGDIEVLALDAAARRMEMLGKGSDRGGSSASMQLAAVVEAGETPATSVLVGTATVIVSGKLAQFGSRLLVPVSDMMLTQFADNFRAAAAQVAVAAPVSTEAVPASASSEAPAAMAASVSAEAAPVRPVPAPVVVPSAGKELNALALAWALIKGWFGGLFGKGAAR